MNDMPSQKLIDMERVPMEELPQRLEELLERVEHEQAGFVLTRNGQDYRLMLPAQRLLEGAGIADVTVDLPPEELALFQAFADALGLTPEELILRLIRRCIDPDTVDEAKAWIGKPCAIELQNNECQPSKHFI